MSETKKYIIGGKEFELKPLSLRQRQLANPVWNKILLALKNLSAIEAEKTDGAQNGAALVELILEFDSIVLAEDDSFAKFLATILTPAGEVWHTELIEKNFETMLEIDEATQAEVLQNFLSKRSGLNNTSPLSTQN